MSTFILILYVSATGLMQVTGFTTMDSCRAAGEKALYLTDTARYVCVKVK